MSLDPAVKVHSPAIEQRRLDNAQRKADANKRKREPVICDICNQAVPQSALSKHKLVMHQVATPSKQAKQPKHMSLEEYKRLTALKVELAVMRSKLKVTPPGAVHVELRAEIYALEKLIRQPRYKATRGSPILPGSFGSGKRR